MSKLKTILLIDDDEATNFMNRRILRKMNIADNIITKLNGQEGINYLVSADKSGNHPRPELIFLDINMPVMNGWEFLDAYRELPLEQQGGVVVVMLTTSLNYQDEELAKEKGILDGFMSKPLKKDDVQEIVDKFFAKRNAAIKND